MDGTQCSVLGLWTIVVCLWIMRLALSLALAVLVWAPVAWGDNVPPLEQQKVIPRFRCEILGYPNGCRCDVDPSGCVRIQPPQPPRKYNPKERRA
jgi:hypothetical protein